MMNGKQVYSYDKGNNKVLCNLNDVCDFNVTNVFRLLNSLADENEQLKQKLENLNLNEKNDIIKKIDGKVFIRM